MKKPHVLLVILFVLCVTIITACQAVQETVALLPSEVLPSETEIPALEETVTVSRVPEVTRTLTVTPTVILKTPAGTDPINCGEPFCQVLWPGLLNRPIAATFRNIIDPTYPYASTRNNTLEIHHGVEFVNSSGTSVLAAQDGEVVYAGNDLELLMGPYNNFYGNVVILKHPELFDNKDVFTLYAHLSEINAAVGDQVFSGEVIGKVGASGSAVGSHLHFEVRIGKNDYENTLNPILWFSPIPFSEQEQSSLLSGRITDREGNPIQDIPLSLERLDVNGNIEEIIYAQTYKNDGVNGFPTLNENFAIPDIAPGNYRFAFVYGTLHQILFALEPGSLGFIDVHLDQ